MKTFLRSTVVLGATVLLTTACASPAADVHSSAPSDQSAATTVDNCGFQVDLDEAPQRIVTVKSTPLELLLALGLGDRVIGSAFLDGDVPEQWADDAAEVPEISDSIPGQEAVLALEPDFVFAGWESALTADGAGDRATLAEFGVGTYVSPSACKEPGYQPEKLTFDDLFAEIEEAGRVFGAEDAAAELVETQRSELDEIEPSDSSQTALWYSSGTDTPYVGAGIGAPQMILEAAGLENIAADVDDTWSSLSWEAVIDANPDVIVLIDADWNTAEQKITMLEQNPATAALDAVKERRYITIPFAAGEAGVRNVDAVRSIVEQLEAID